MTMGSSLDEEFSSVGLDGSLKGVFVVVVDVAEVVVSLLDVVVGAEEVFISDDDDEVEVSFAVVVDDEELSFNVVDDEEVSFAVVDVVFFAAELDDDELSVVDKELFLDDVVDD